MADELISPLRLHHTGFYSMDALTANTAHGYMDDPSGRWRTNMFHLPIIGVSDGGLYTCGDDLDILWRSIFAGDLLSEHIMQAFLDAQVVRSSGKSYGLGVCRMDRGANTAYYALGSDFGVDFFTAYFPKHKVTASALGNTELRTYPLLDALFSELL